MKQPLLTNHVAVQLTGICKKYEIHHEKPTLVEKFVKGRNETFWALKDVNLTIRKGEKIGIIGPNGSGKTTLLKIIAGIATPTNGTVQIHGKVVSLIDLEAGFHADLTGYQNIYLNGLLLGLSKKDITNRLNSIIAFADIKQFIDVPLFTYSSGMILRLGFAVAIHANPDILILDETLSVGDENFQQKAHKKIHKLFTQNITSIIVSHNLPFLRKYCKRIVLLHRGSPPIDSGVSLLTLYEHNKTRIAVNTK